MRTFSYIQKSGARMLVTASEEEAEQVKRKLLEESFINDLGIIYELINNQWKSLDYYND
jgi:hypothetical protein